MQYNESQYNGDSYNLTNYAQTMVETITLTDGTVAKSISSLRTDSQGMADALSDGVSLSAFLDTVTIYQRANTPFAYNNGQYNFFMYNARADEDEILLMPGKVMGDGMGIADAMQPFTIEKVMGETMTPTDLTVFFFDIIHPIDIVALEEVFRIEITNKALDATVRINDWLSIEQSPQSDAWGDQ